MSDGDGTLNRLKWAVYVGAIVLIIVQIIIGVYQYQTGGLTFDSALNRVLFIGFGAYLYFTERRQVRERKRNVEFRELEGRIDDDLRLAVRFVFLNAGVFGENDDDIDEWAAHAARIFDVDEAKVRNEFERLRADLEYHSRTGELPDP